MCIYMADLVGGHSSGIQGLFNDIGDSLFKLRCKISVDDRGGTKTDNLTINLGFTFQGMFQSLKDERSGAFTDDHTFSISFKWT